MASSLGRWAGLELSLLPAGRRHRLFEPRWSSTDVNAWTIRSIQPQASRRLLATAASSSKAPGSGAAAEAAHSDPPHLTHELVPEVPAKPRRASPARPRTRRPALYNALIPNTKPVKLPSRPVVPSTRPEWFKNLERQSTLRAAGRRGPDRAGGPIYASDKETAAQEEENRLHSERRELSDKRDAAWARMVSSMNATKVPGAATETALEFSQPERDARPKDLVQAERSFEVLLDELDAKKAIAATATPTAAPKVVPLTPKGLLDPTLRGPVPETEHIIFRSTTPLRRPPNRAFLIMIALSFVGVVYAGLLLQTPMAMIEVYPTLGPIVKVVAWALLVGSQLFAYLTWRGIFRTVSYVSVPAAQATRITPSTPLKFYSLAYQLHPMIRDSFPAHTYTAGSLHCQGRLTTRDLSIEGVGRELTNPVKIAPTARALWQMFTPGRWGEETGMSDSTVRCQLEDAMGFGDASLDQYLQFSLKRGFLYNLKILLVRMSDFLPFSIVKSKATTPA